MTDRTNPAGLTLPTQTSWKNHAVFAAACALVIGIFTLSAVPGIHGLSAPNPADSFYNLLVQGLQAGQLNLKMDAPPELARLSDPYDPALSGPYITDVWDMSYYHGKMYLYFGIGPVLVLLWPFAALTGHYLSDKDAAVVFFSVGFLAGAFLLRSIWRRCFPQVSVWTLALGIVAFGVGVGVVDAMSLWYDVYEVAGNSAFAFTMLALLGLWRTLNETRRPVTWMVLASVAYGLAIASRPSMLFGVVIFLVPAARLWHNGLETAPRKQVWSLVAGAVLPLMLIGAGLMLYNQLRFGDPLEFGLHYQVQGGYNPRTSKLFNTGYLWFDFWFYFLQPAKWTGHFPFLENFALTNCPPGHAGTGVYNGGITWIQFAAWAAFAVLFLWKARWRNGTLRWFASAIFFLFLICAVTISLFITAAVRYELDFFPALMVLAVIGIFCLDSGMDSPAAQCIARWGWRVLLVCSLAFELLAGVQAHAQANYFVGNSLIRRSRPAEAMPYFQTALKFEPGSADFLAGLGAALLAQGQVDEAIVQYQKALNIEPNMALARNDLGYCLLEKGQIDEAILQYERAVEIDPDYAEAHMNLGFCLIKAGRAGDAITEFQTEIKLQPGSVPAYNNLGNAFRMSGMATNAMASYHKAIELEPGFLPARIHLAWMLATWPESSVRNGNAAVALAEQANNMTRGSSPAVLRTLAAAYAEAGRFSEAVATAKHALTLAGSGSNAVLTNELQKEITLYQNHSALLTQNE